MNSYQIAYLIILIFLSFIIGMAIKFSIMIKEIGKEENIKIGVFEAINLMVSCFPVFLETFFEEILRDFTIPKIQDANDMKHSIDLPITLKEITERKRPTKDEYYLNIAKAVSERSTCNERRRYGAVIVKNDRIVSTGYNGSARGEINCCDTGICYRQINNIPSGKEYEQCLAIHAEENAIQGASPEEREDSTLYLYCFDIDLQEEITGIPCLLCFRNLKNSGISIVINRDGIIDIKQNQFNKIK